MKFNIYSVSQIDHEQRIGCWTSCIVDYNNKKIVSKGLCKNPTQHELDIISIIKTLTIMKQRFDSSSDLIPHICIQYYTDSLYCTNLIKDWLPKWKSETNSNRPNSIFFSMIEESVALFKPKIQVTYAPSLSNEMFIVCNHIATKELQSFKESSIDSFLFQPISKTIPLQYFDMPSLTINS